MTTLLHAVAVGVAHDGAAPLAGVIIFGEPGSGKSSLALTLIDSCPRRRSALIADDVVIVDEAAGSLVATAPERLSGLIEVRGFGPARVPSVASAALALAVDLSLPSERVPEPRFYQPFERAAAIPLYPFRWKGAEATAAARLRTMILTIFSGHIEERQQDSAPIFRRRDS